MRQTQRLSHVRAQPNTEKKKEMKRMKGEKVGGLKTDGGRRRSLCGAGLEGDGRHQTASPEIVEPLFTPGNKMSRN